MHGQLKKYARALAGVALVECQPANQRDAGLIPSLGHMSGLQARSPVGGARGNHTLTFPSLSPSLPLSKK